MRHGSWAGLLVLACCAAAGPAAADGLDGARAAFTEGRFVEAADIAGAVETSEAQALAADALAIQGYYLAAEDDKQPLFQRAVAYAETAVELGPDNPEAHLQTAHAMGRYAQTIGVLEALNEGYADRIRAAIDATLALDPDNVGAHLSLAAWHAEIVASAGIMAKLLYGATEDEALAHYRRAVALAPDDISVNLEYAIGLMTLDEEANRDEARGYLEKALAAAPADARDRLLQGRAGERLAALDAL